MRRDLPAPGGSTVLSRQAVTVTLYKTGSPRDLIAGTPGLTTVDLTPYAANVDQTSTGVTVRLVHHDELSGAAGPTSGELVSVRIDGFVAFNGIVDLVSAERLSRGGERTLTMTVRRRDATAWWRDVRRVSPLFGIATDLGSMARVFCGLLNLAPEEYDLPNTGLYLAHDNAQLADVTAWDMLETIFQPALLEPWVDARGVVKTISRRVDRPPDLQLTWEQVLDVSRGAGRPPLTAVRVKWMDPELTKVTQQDQVLAQTSLSCGFFKPWSGADVYWSEDHSQRAALTRLVVKQSINDGLLHVGRESYSPRGEFGGHVRASLDAFLPSLAAYSLGALVVTSRVPDGVQVGPTGTGATVPAGRVEQQIALNAVLMTLMTQGFGVYEVWGTPYDYVHAINEVEAYDQAAEDWEEKVEEISNDLIPTEAVAQALAVNELLYRARSASRSEVTIVDDLRVEVGDVLALPDGRRLYVADYSRPLSRGADATLRVEGFFS